MKNSNVQAKRVPLQWGFPAVGCAFGVFFAVLALFYAEGNQDRRVAMYLALAVLGLSLWMLYNAAKVRQKQQVTEDERTRRVNEFRKLWKGPSEKPPLHVDLWVDYCNPTISGQTAMLNAIFAGSYQQAAQINAALMKFDRGEITALEAYTTFEASGQSKDANRSAFRNLLDGKMPLPH